MARKGITTKLTDTLSLTELVEFVHPTSGRTIPAEFWLYDSLEKCNIAMYARSKDQAFIEALNYYQKRFVSVDTELRNLQKSVDSFISNVHTCSNENWDD